MTAEIVATLYNAHWDTEGVPYTPDDVLGKGDREERKREAYRLKWMAQRIIRDAVPGKAKAPEWLLGTIRDNEARKGRLN